jgi:hypothetical protein
MHPRKSGKTHAYTEVPEVLMNAKEDSSDDDAGSKEVRLQERAFRKEKAAEDRDKRKKRAAERDYDVKDPHTWKVPQLKSYLREYSLPSGEKRMKWRKGLCVTFRII